MFPVFPLNSKPEIEDLKERMGPMRFEKSVLCSLFPVSGKMVGQNLTQLSHFGMSSGACQCKQTLQTYKRHRNNI